MGNPEESIQGKKRGNILRLHRKNCESSGDDKMNCDKCGKEVKNGTGGYVDDNIPVCDDCFEEFKEAGE